MNKNTWQGQILIPFTHFSCYLPDDSAGRIARELWWRSEEFFSVSIPLHHGSASPCIAWGTNNRLVGGLCSETYSHPIAMIIIPNVETHKRRDINQTTFFRMVACAVAISIDSAYR
jgi:hypothetical protein